LIAANCIHLESREKAPMLDENGRIKGWQKGFGGPRSIAEYAFTDLYTDADETMRHYVAMLERLEAIPRFSPEAADSGASAAAA
jgi:hypothetical protein